MLQGVLCQDHNQNSGPETSEFGQSSPLPIIRPRSSNNSVTMTTGSLPARTVSFDLIRSNPNDRQNDHDGISDYDDQNEFSPNILRRSNSFDSLTPRPLKSYATLANIQEPSDAAEIAPRAAKPIPPIKPSSGTKIIQDFLVSSALNVANASKIPSDSAHPPLNLQLIGANFGKFVQKCGFIFAIQGAVEDIVMWKNPSNTLLTMVIYVYICLYPKLLFLIPPVGLLAVLIYYYEKKYPNGLQTMKRGQHGRRRFHKSKHHDPYLPPENSVDYLKNMQNIQNLMGLISEGYDAVVPLLKHVDWSNEYETLVITQGVIVLMTILCLTVWIIPWSYIFIVAGLGIFIANTQFMKALMKETSPFLMQHGKLMIERCKNYLSTLDGEWDESNDEASIEQNWVDVEKEEFDSGTERNSEVGSSSKS
ncbi:1231_t:CDS:2 [Acaulospora morrowiae]|uniref:1231_t:CDS:1 n=1 Tax=Acaulospora morrowiae TaxID=94023 RepID=A0A9N8WES3_9GLOM|nr:1231_t:CDS:2 [Acaulospora morrowiae]